MATHYWLIREVFQGENYLRRGEALGIISFTISDDSSATKIDGVLNRIDMAVGIASSEWHWDTISKSQFETYREFGFEEFKIQ